MKNKRTIVVIVMCIALVLTFTVLISYAYWRISQTQTGTNTINGACLSIRLEEYYDENDNLIEGLTLENAWPISDQEGSAQEGYQFKVVNECEEDLTYQVILDSLEVSGGRINPEFVKVELDDKSIRRYGRLEDAPETDEYPTIAHKKVYTGTILGNDEVEHTIKLWISEDSTNDDIGKAFSSKIRVEAGQQIVPSSGLTLKILSNPTEPDATINNLRIGDRVGYGTEQFYVIGIDGTNIKLLSRYLINVGEYANPNGTYGLQYRELAITRNDVTDSGSAVEYLFNQNDRIFYGAVPFSDEGYWLENNGWVSPFSLNGFVYNNQASISTYVNEYVQTLQTMGLNVINGTLLSLEKLNELCNTDFTVDGYSYSECPSYLFETSYWLGSVHGSDSLWDIKCVDGIFANYYGNAKIFGVRPVITISLL